jgi:hypothetical protein
MDGKEWYKQQLQTPEWKEKRREIYERDDYVCVDCTNRGIECKRGTVRIHCHHKYYVKGMKPWEYPAHALVSLCDACHEKRHRLLTMTHDSHEDAEMWILFSEAEAALLEMLIEEEEEARRKRIDRLERKGADWDGNGRFWSYVDKKGVSRFFDEDGNPM